MHGRIPFVDEEALLLVLLRINGADEVAEQLLRYVFIDELYARHLLQFEEEEEEPAGAQPESDEA